MTEIENAYKPPSPNEVIAQIRGKIAERARVDRDLSAILEDHILTERPDERAVANAAEHIVALATRRSAETDHVQQNNN